MNHTALFMLFSVVAFPWPARISGILVKKRNKTKTIIKKQKQKTVFFSKKVYDKTQTFVTWEQPAGAAGREKQIVLNS